MRFSLWLTRPLLCLSDFSSLRLIFTFQFLRVACPFLIFLFRLPSSSFSVLSWCLVSCLVLSVSFQFYYAFNSHLGWVGFAVSPVNLLHCLRTFYWWVGDLGFTLSGFIWTLGETLWTLRFQIKILGILHVRFCHERSFTAFDLRKFLRSDTP